MEEVGGIHFCENTADLVVALTGLIQEENR
jgi:hypothetical protein